MSGSSTLADLLAELARQLPPNDLQDLASVFERTDAPTGRARVMGAVAHSAVRDRVAAVLDRWATECPRLPGLGLAVGLRSAQAADSARRGMLRVELVGSGPASVEATLRRIDRVLLELIREARSELWVVCFAVNNVPEILEALRDAAERDVELNLVLESADESQGRLSFDQIDEIVGMLDQRANVYLWPTERRPCDAQGRRGVLHAKCAVADRQKVLISSANLTEYAMTLNIELGVRVISASAGNQLVRHLKSLNASGILVRTERRL